MSSHLEEALRLAELNFPVFPLIKGRKDPATPHGCKDATTDESAILAWWESNPEANIGLATDGLLVVDVDGAENPWLAGQTERQLDLARAPISQTAGGGRHYLFRYAAGRNSAGKLAEKVDTRGAGGYIVAPPSKVSGREYKWIGPLDVPRDRLPEPPGWLIDQLDGRESTPSTRTSAPVESNIIPDGQRNDTLARLAGTMRRVGMGLAEIRAALQAANAERCRPPMDAAEVDRIAESVARYEPDQISTAVAEGWANDPVICSTINDPGAFPDALLNVGGFVGDVSQFSVDTAFKPQPILALGAALPLLGALTGRKVRDPYDTRTNVYALGVCDSGGGKERARQVNEKVLIESGNQKLLGPEGFASKAGIVNHVAINPSVLFQWDEFGRLLKTTGDTKSPHLFNVPTVLMTFFSKASGTFIGDCYADPEKNKVIDQPNVCIYGTTVPQSFFESLTTESVTDGFLSRMFVFIAEGEDPPMQAPIAVELPQQIIDVARYWADFNPGGNLAGQHPEPYVVPYEPEAETVMANLMTLAEESKRALGYPFGTLWTRTVEKARKLALLYACSANHENPVVTKAAAEWAAELSVWLTRKMIYLASRWVSENRQESNAKRVYRIIEQHGRIDRSSLTRLTQWLSKREREEILVTLVESGQIETDVETTKTKARMWYMLPGLKNSNDSVPIYSSEEAGIGA